jgi:hypothetical protein
MNLNYKNIRNIVDLNETPTGYKCLIDIDFDNNGVYETVEYIVRLNGGGLCDKILEDINSGNYEGEISSNVQIQNTTPFFIINKAKLFNMLDDDEYASFEAIINSLSPRKRAVFNNSIMMDSTNELTNEIIMAMMGLFGEDRVNELLS